MRVVVEQKICLELLERALRVGYYGPRPGGKEIFVGKARDWKEVSDPKFLKCLADSGISPDTKITIYEQGEKDGEKVYAVSKF